jgi:hypothetical protein
VRARLKEGCSPSETASKLCDRCLAADTHGVGLGCDNMSVVLVLFRPALLTAET